jgi:SAM-dependent methyltransferase
MGKREVVMSVTNTAAHYDSLAPLRDRYRARNKYYYSLLHKEYRYLIPAGKKVLEVGCSTGELLNDLKPSLGVGIDISEKMISLARQKFPHLQFYASEIKDVMPKEKLDYIVLSGLLGDLEDIQQFFMDLRKFCHPHTRVIIEYYSYFWQSLLRLAENIRLKIPKKTQNWITYQDIYTFLELAGYQPIKKDRSILLPVYIPLISYLVNKFLARLPLLNALTLNHFVIARPLLENTKDFSVTVLVPCRNEKGNIEQAITRTPVFGASQEFIFVEGHSQDGTYEEAERVREKYPQKDIKLFKQPGKGKGDAVRFGFNKAKGEVLMMP